MSIDGRNIVVMNDAVSEENINFGNIGKIEINFIEMERQSNKINDLGVTIGKKMNIIINAINELAGLVGSSVNIDLRDYSKKFLNKTQSISNFMKKQMNNYIDINNFTEYKIFQLNNLIKQLYDEDGAKVNYIDKNGNVVTTEYQKILANKNRSYTTSDEYDFTNLREFIKTYEGTTAVYVDGTTGKKYYKIVWDVNGWAAGPGVHLSNIGQYSSDVAGYIPADIVDAEADKLLLEIRQNIENALDKDQYNGMKLSDQQLDSLTSLLYNTGKNPEYFLDRYKSATEQGKTLYEYSTSQWVNAGGERLSGLVIRRAGENVLFEQGYDAWKKWNEEHPLGSSTSNLGV